MRRLELAVPGALAEIAGDDRGGGAEGGQEILERLDLREVGVAAEVQIGEVDDRDGGAVMRTKLLTERPTPNVG